MGVTVIDSLSVSARHGMVVLVAAEAAQKGRSHDEIFIADTLEGPQMRGRIGGAAAFASSLLNLEPLLQLPEGRVEPPERECSKPGRGPQSGLFKR